MYMKRINYKLLLTLAVFCLLFACTDKKRTATSDVKEISFKEAPKDYLLASAFKNMHMVQLESNDDSMISDIKRIIDVEGKLIVLTKDKEIFCFDRSTGKFIRKIGNIGEGPEEYLDATDMYYNEKEKTLSVIDYLKSTSINYTLDGKFVNRKEFKTSMSWASSADLSSDGYLMVSTKLTGGYPANEYAYMVISPNETVTGVDPFAPVKVEGYSTDFASHPMTRCDDGLRFFKFINDTIFTLSKGETIPYCRANFGRKMPAKDVVAKLGSYDVANMIGLYQSSGYALPLDKIYECDKFIVLVPILNTISGYYFIDKDKFEGIHISSSAERSVEYSMFLQGRSIINIAGSEKNELISVFLPEDIETVQLLFSEQKDLKVYNKKLRPFFEKADAEGNPCLVFYEN